MSKTESLSTLVSSSNKAGFSPLTASSYALPSSLSPFMSSPFLKKDSPPRKETIGCMRCTFLRSLLGLCRGVKSKSKPRYKHVLGTQISTDQEIERGTIIMQDERNVEREKNLMEFIEESKEMTSHSLLLPKDSVVIMRSTSNISNSSNLLKTSSNLYHYPLNELFLYRNEIFGEHFLTKILIERNEYNQRRSVGSLLEMRSPIPSRQIAKKCISFIGENFLQSRRSKLLTTQLKGNPKRLLLDVSSDAHTLSQLKNEFSHVISIQSNFFVAQQLSNELQSANCAENIEFIVCDPLGFRGIENQPDAIHLNFSNFNEKSLENTLFLHEMTMKYTGLAQCLIVTLPKLVSLDQTLKFFSGVLVKFQNKSLRILYNMTKKRQSNNIYAIVQQENKGDYDEEATFFTNYFRNDSQNASGLKESFKAMLSVHGTHKLVSYIKLLEANYTPKKLLLQKFMELAKTNEDGPYFVIEEVENNRESLRNNEIREVLEFSRVIPENTRSFSSYNTSNNNNNNNETELEEEGRKLGEEAYSESRDVMINLVKSKNVSSY